MRPFGSYTHTPALEGCQATTKVGLGRKKSLGPPIFTVLRLSLSSCTQGQYLSHMPQFLQLFILGPCPRNPMCAPMISNKALHCLSPGLCSSGIHEASKTPKILLVSEIILAFSLTNNIEGPKD